MSGTNVTRLHVIGLGVGAGMRLSEPAQQALRESKTVIGSPRQLELAQGLGEITEAALLELPKLAELQSLIDGLPEGPISILASGDPRYYGIGRWLMQRFDSAQLRFYPAVSSIQAMCNRIGLALQDCRVISLHGRELAGLRRVLKQNSNIIALTDRHSHPRALAQACLDAGFEQSRLHLGEDLGTEHERYREFAVADLVADVEFECSTLNVSVIQTRGRGGVLPEFPGIDDRLFATDGEPGQGMFTKREVRLAILSLLQPGNDDVIWDIGAGCGGVTTELSHWNERVIVYAIEQHPERLACIAENRQRFGCVSNLHIVDGRAPQALDDLPVANKVFIGGNDGELDAILTLVWQRLPEQGVMVASAVTEATQARLQAFALTLAPAQVETLQVAVSRGMPGNDGIDYQAKLPITLFKFTRSGDEA
jgi:precorrin-6Y C5,15-methyltransferase (decarboxylating)